MDERKKQVLYAIITDYIDTAEPVGSRAVAKKSGLGVSSATIRNEMSDLEELGYIEQPHASAGRKPSDKGYRYYVDYLMHKEQLTPADADFIRHSLSENFEEMDTLMQHCSHMISRLTNYTALVALHTQRHKLIESVRLIPLNEQQLLLVAVLQGGELKNRLINLCEPINPDKLLSLDRFLRQSLTGADVAKLELAVLNEMLTAFGQQQSVLRRSLELFNDFFVPHLGDWFFSYGTHNMLSQPEFQDHDKLKLIIGALEEDDILRALLGKNAADGKTIVTIGKELDEEDMQDCSIVTAPYDLGNDVQGVIGVIGPTRMSYQKTVPLLEFMAQILSDLHRKE